MAVSMRVPILLGNLCSRLANGGETAAAIKLLGAMLRFDAPPGKGQDLRSVIARMGRYEYEMALKNAPMRLRGFYGAAKAAEAVGDTKAAASYFDKLARLTRNADSERPEIQEVRKRVARLVVERAVWLALLPVYIVLALFVTAAYAVIVLVVDVRTRLRRGTPRD